jgi:hypothetical protein
MKSIKELKSINLWGMNENNMILNLRIKTSYPILQVEKEIRKAAEEISWTIELDTEIVNE